MTARLLKGSLRATSWLAGWLDYGVAIVLAAGRLIRVPLPAAEAEFEPACAQVVAEAYEQPAFAGYRRPRWDEPARPSQRWFVRPAEVIMLSLSFFLAAHLLSGGTASVSAPQIRSWSLVPASAAPAEVSTVLVPSATADTPAESVMVTVPLHPTAAAGATQAPAVAATTREAENEVAPAPAPAPGLGAAAVHETPPTAPPAPAEQPAPAAVVAPAPPPAVPAGVLSYAEIVAAAAVAGWPADRLDQVARVAWCESRFRPDAVGYGTYGLMQLIPFWFEATGTDLALWSDPVTNLRVALFAFASDAGSGNSAWGPWSCKPDQVIIP